MNAWKQAKNKNKILQEKRNSMIMGHKKDTIDTKGHNLIM